MHIRGRAFRATAAGRSGRDVGPLPCVHDDGRAACVVFEPTIVAWGISIKVAAAGGRSLFERAVHLDRESDDQ